MSKTECSQLLDEAYQYVKTLLQPLKSQGYYFHNWDHTKEVFEHAKFYAQELKLNEQDTCKLLLAALFHDTWFVRIYNWHEEASAKIAEKFLQGKIPADWLEQIKNMILATKVGKEPQTLLEAALKDADVDNIRSEEFLIKSDLLKEEIETLFDKQFTPQKWIKTLQKALEIGQCRTPVCEKKKMEGLKNNKSFVKLYGDFLQNH